LALWQAKFIEKLLKQQGLKTELVLVKSEGDVNLISPLYEMGVQGIFTKTLDSALLNNHIDIAVHSLKDVPTQLPANLTVAAIPRRASVIDVLVCKDPDFKLSGELQTTIATSSLRRKAQWLNRFPSHKVESIRGNINTRLEKLSSTLHWNGALFAAAGISRIGLDIVHKIDLEWMLPAPAQGALVVICRQDDSYTLKNCKLLNDSETKVCTDIERSFLKSLNGGCSMPVGALARVAEDRIEFKGNILSVDGKRKTEIELSFEKKDFGHAGCLAAAKLLSEGGDKIALELKKYMVL
jgi:hydroxymethylbilane synthase